MYLFVVVVVVVFVHCCCCICSLLLMPLSIVVVVVVLVLLWLLLFYSKLLFWPFAIKFVRCICFKVILFSPHQASQIWCATRFSKSLRSPPPPASRAESNLTTHTTSTTSPHQNTAASAILRTPTCEEAVSLMMKRNTDAVRIPNRPSARSFARSLTHSRAHGKKGFFCPP